MHYYTQLEATLSIDSQMLSPESIDSGLGKGTEGHCREMIYSL